MNSLLRGTIKSFVQNALGGGEATTESSEQNALVENNPNKKFAAIS